MSILRDVQKPKRKRGRPAPEYGIRICPFCARQVKLAGEKLICVCGWAGMAR